MEERKIIFSNILNKVPVLNIAQAFNKSENEIISDFKYIIQKIKNYCFINGHPAIYCDTIEEAQREKYSIYPILNVINLDKAPIYKVTNQKYNGEPL